MNAKVPTTQLNASTWAKAPVSFLQELWDTIVKTFLSPGESEDVLVSLNKMKYIIGVLIIFIIIGLVFYFSYKKASEDPLPADNSVSLIIGKQTSKIKNEIELIGNKSFYESLLPTIPVNQRYLVNFSPLTGSLGGYIGGNVFYSTEYITRALRAGIRSFILPISVYMDDNKKPPNWPLSGKPAIVCRDKEGNITSVNALTIQKFCMEILSFKAQNPAQAEEPYILYIQEDKKYIPDRVKNEKEYVMLMADIAKELEGISSSRLLHLGAYGSATTGGINADKILLEIPIEQLKNKVLIMTDFDTKLQLKDAYIGIKPQLHEYANFVYKPNLLESIALDQALSPDGKFEDNTRITWYVSNKEYYQDVPSKEKVIDALDKGLQAIPLPFFSVPNKELEGVHKQWNGFSMRVKPERARFTKQPPIVPKMMKEKLNARVEGSTEPGEIIIR